MSRSAGVEFAVEVHPPDWQFSAGKSWIAGWIRPEPGQMVTDVRARIHDRVILGLSGLPHPAFTAAPGEPSVSFLAGFSLLLTPHPGATLLQLEAREASGQWTEFFRTRITAAPDAPPAPEFPKLSQAFSRLIIALVRRRMLSPGRSWAKLADDLMATFVAEPLNAYPNLPFIGALEEPRETGRFRYGVIPVTGWLANPQAIITGLSAVIDPLPPVALPRGLARQDISGIFPLLDEQINSAFAGEIALPGDFAAPVLLKIFAELDNGETHLAFAQRFTPRFHRGPGEMPPQVSGFTYVCAVCALHRAAGRYALSSRGLIRAAHVFWSSYQAMPSYRPARAFRKRSWFHTPSVARHTLEIRNGWVGDKVPATTVISTADDMLVHDAVQYFQIGREALTLVQEACTMAGCSRVEAILDLPCGHGRVARWLRSAYPAAKLVVCDTQEAGVNFCVDHLGASGMQAAGDGSHWKNLPGPFDIIWCGSLLTHFGLDQWLVHLRRFAESLSPNGVLVFTTHGLVALDKLQTGEKDYGLPPDDVSLLCADAVAEGFGYVGYSGTPDYGISVSQPTWIRELIDRETDLRVLAIHESAWDQHQDVVVCTRRAPR